MEADKAAHQFKPGSRFEDIIRLYDLANGLPAEIKARQQQYEFYRDKLLTFRRKAC